MTPRQFCLQTATTSYVVSLLPDGSGLVLDEWGPLTRAPMPPAPLTAHPQHEVTADVAPLEYASSGTRHAHFCELVAHYPTGVNGSRWQVDETGIEFDPPQHALDIAFDDETGTLRLVHHLRTSPDHDVVRRWVSVSVAGNASGVVELTRCFSGGWALPIGPGAQIDYLAGEWGREFGRHSLPLPVGTFSIASRRGFTGHEFAPVVTLTPLADPTRAYGIALAFSGSWRINVEATAKSGGAGNRVRVSAGVDDQDTVIRLGPGESFTTPETHGVFSDGGPEGVRQAWHHFQRAVLARDLSPVTRPVVYNSWYATEFDIRVDHQTRLASVAADLGAEAFVVDDGWMPKRTTDAAGLGDWWPDPKRFPDGLHPIVDAVLAQGLRFGLWVEPECVNPDSDLFRAHPDWVYRAADRPYVTVRNQLVLDFGRAEVVAWAQQALRDLLETYPISYLKWDFNRPITDGGRPGDPHGSEWAIQHARGYYAVMRMLREEYPQVTVEACASGGGRIDHAVLALCDVVWPSDETGPRDRMRIQDGFLTAYPACVMSSWVTDEPGTDDRLACTLGYRFVVAMAGVLGIGSDIVTWDEARRGEARELVALYKEIRPVITTGRVRVHGFPGEPGYALEYAGAPEFPDRVVVLVYDADRDRRDREVRIRPFGLAAQGSYALSGSDLVVSGASARSAGVLVPWRVAADADVLVFDRIG